MVVALPRGVNQQETERLRRAQVTNLMLISGRHGAERPHRHGNGGSAVLPPVADLTRTRDDKKQVPCSRVEVRRQPLPRVYAEEARFRFRYLMENSLRTCSMDIAPCFIEHIADRDDLGSIHFPLPASSIRLASCDNQFWAVQCLS